MGYKQTPHERLPVAMETVMAWGYPREKVEEVYRRMTSDRHTSSSTSGQNAIAVTRNGEVPLGASNYALADENTDHVTARALFEEMESLYGLSVLGSSGAKHGAQPVLTETILRTPAGSASEVETSSFVEEDGDSAERQNTSSLHRPQETSTNNPTTTATDDAVTTFPTAADEVSPGASLPSPRSEPSANQEDATQDKENAHVPVSDEMHNDQPAAAEDEANKKKQELRKRLQVLKSENRRLKERQTCRNCHERPVSLTLLPCGHFCFCEECGSKFTACPICRKTILADVRTFVS